MNQGRSENVNENKHSPTPWKVHEWPESNKTIRSAVEETDIADITFWDGSSEEITEANANAALIVLAVNNFDAMKKALEMMLEVHEADGCYHDHHGLCQAHNLRRNEKGEPECQVAFARAVLANLSKEATS